MRAAVLPCFFDDQDPLRGAAVGREHDLMEGIALIVAQNIVVNHCSLIIP